MEVENYKVMDKLSEDLIELPVEFRLGEEVCNHQTNATSDQTLSVLDQIPPRETLSAIEVSPIRFLPSLDNSEPISDSNSETGNGDLDDQPTLLHNESLEKVNSPVSPFIPNLPYGSEKAIPTASLNYVIGGVHNAIIKTMNSPSESLSNQSSLAA